MTPHEVMTLLNSLSVGQIDSIDGKLVQARSACLELGESELADRLEEARSALEVADMRTYRKRVETVVSRLGHLR